MAKLTILPDESLGDLIICGTLTLVFCIWILLQTVRIMTCHEPNEYLLGAIELNTDVAKLFMFMWSKIRNYFVNHEGYDL